MGLPPFLSLRIGDKVPFDGVSSLRGATASWCSPSRQYFACFAAPDTAYCSVLGSSKLNGTARRVKKGTILSFVLMSGRIEWMARSYHNLQGILAPGECAIALGWWRWSWCSNKRKGSLTCKEDAAPRGSWRWLLLYEPPIMISDSLGIFRDPSCVGLSVTDNNTRLSSTRDSNESRRRREKNNRRIQTLKRKTWMSDSFEPRPSLLLLALRGGCGWFLKC